MMSETTTGDFVGTLRGPELPSLSRPAWFRAQRSPWQHGMAAALALHRQTLATLDVPTVQALTAAEAQALMNRRIERMKAWRAAQPADRLPEDDVRAVTGAAHADVAAPLLARLRKIDMDG
jgi:hypothetical protein